METENTVATKQKKMVAMLIMLLGQTAGMKDGILCHAYTGNFCNAMVLKLTFQVDQ